MRPRRVSFRTALLGLVLGPLLCAVGTIAVVAYVNSRASIDALKQKHYALISHATSLEVQRLLEPAQRLLAQFCTMAQRGMLPLDDSEQLGLVLVEGLRARPLLGWLSHSDAERGRFVGAWRREDGAIVLNQSSPDLDGGRPRETIVDESGAQRPISRVLEPYDPRTKAWFQRAINSADLIWSEPYLFNEGQPGITAGMAHRSRDGTRVAGVFTTDFFLSSIADYLNTITRERHSYALVLTRGGQVIGESSSLRGDRAALRKATLSAVPVALETIASGEPVQFHFDAGGETFDAVFSAFSLRGGLDYIVGVVGPESEFLGAVLRNARLTFVIGCAATAFATLLAIFVAARIARPLQAIGADLREVGRFNLRPGTPPRSAIREIHLVWQSIARMKAGLRSFGRYVPVEVVRGLLSQDDVARLGGQNRHLTVLFSDMEGFTSMAEKLTPEQVFAELESYLEVSISVVEAASGTVDKFMGDGVLAFFNAPNDVPDHATLACRAALDMQRRLDETVAQRQREGRPIFRVRIGLHTGDVLVGNIGTRKRFSYTVVGDGVNLASRLEKLSKLYGTRILVSQTTFQEAQHEFEWRMIDRIAVQGRSDPTLICELLGRKGELSAALLRARDAYEEGLTAFFAGNTGEAMAYFQAAHEMQPQDVAAAVMLARVSGQISAAVAGEEPPARINLAARMGEVPR